MQHEIDILNNWITEKGYPDLEAAARSAVLRYPNLFDKNDDGSIPDISLEAHKAISELDASLVLLDTMKGKLESLKD